MTGNVEMQDLPPPVLYDEQTIQQFERDSWHGEEVEGRDDFAVVLKKGQPTLPWITPVLHTSEIARNGSFRHLEADL